MYARTPHSYGNPSRKVSITDQPNTRPLPADFFDESIMARPVEDNNRKVFDLAIKPSSDRFQILRNGSIQVQRSLASRAGDNLLHVPIRRVQQSTGLRDSKHSDRIRCASSAKIRTFERVHGNIDAGVITIFESLGPDHFADIEHGSVVALALAYDNPAVDRDFVKGFSHRLHGSPIRFFAISLSHSAGAC